MNTVFRILSLTIVLGAALPCFAQPATPSHQFQMTQKEMMEKELAGQEAIVNGWEKQASQQTNFSLCVGILGLLIGVLQSYAKPWVKVTTVVLGFCVSAITLYTHTEYPADYKTLQRSVFQARPFIRQLKNNLGTFEFDKNPQNQGVAQADFWTACGKIDLIGAQILGLASQEQPKQEPPKQQPEQKQPGTFLRIPEIETVYAQSQLSPPDWTTATTVQTDTSGTYVVGVGQNQSLMLAKTSSLDDAVAKGARWLLGSQSQSQPPARISDLVRHVADVADNWYTYDSKTAVYKYYTRLRLANELRRLNVADLVPDRSPITPMQLELPSDSAAQVANLPVILLLKHMGFAPITADLYVLSGSPASNWVVEPYTGDRGKSEQYVAHIKSSLQTCNGHHAQIDGYTVWCFKVQRKSIREEIGRKQYLGGVAADGSSLELLAVNFDYEAHSIGVEVRGVK